jgi:hypothetical protein
MFMARLVAGCAAAAVRRRPPLHSRSLTAAVAHEHDAHGAGVGVGQAAPAHPSARYVCMGVRQGGCSACIVVTLVASARKTWRQRCAMACGMEAMLGAGIVSPPLDRYEGQSRVYVCGPAAQLRAAGA